MPYRSDGRSGDERAVRVAELAAAVQAAKLRVRAAAGKLRELEKRLDEERRALDAAVAEAEDATRRGLHRSLAASDKEDPRMRDALRTSGAVNALELAISRAKSKQKRANEASPPPSLEAARVAAREARKKRAWLAARSTSSLESARARLADAVAAHDEAIEAHQRALPVDEEA